MCFGRGEGFGDPACQSIVGTHIDAAVGQLLVEAVTPMALQPALAVQQEISARLEEADRLRRRQVERAQYEADQARHRYMQVDPVNRLVADSLEADWNAKLRALGVAQEDYQRQRTADRLAVDDNERQRIFDLATDFPAIWRDPNTPQRERKRMLGLPIEDVTLTKQRSITAAVRLRGGATTTLYVVTTTWKEWRTRHPDTRVLSLDTGHRRDYSEGAAYSDYFGTQRLMFTVPRHDARLPNKAEVLALRLPQAGGETLAIAADFLAARPLYQDRVGSLNMVVLTDASGANRVYESRELAFTSWDKVATVRDSLGRTWRMDESRLSGPNGETLNRLPAHRAFWFGWHAAFPDTRLVK